MSFVKLPPDVRQRIYVLAGLVRPCAIDLLREGSRKKDEHGDGKECFSGTQRRCDLDSSRNTGLGVDCCHCPQLPLGLFRVSHGIHDEVLALFWGSNDFVLPAKDARELRMLCGISPTHLRHLRALLIRLTCFPCPRGHKRSAFCNGRCRICGAAGDRIKPMLSLQSEPEVRLLEAWSEICSHLGSSLTLQRVRLGIVADVSCVRAGQQIVEELRRLPTLEQLGICLASKPDKELRFIADDAVQKMTSQFQRSGAFPFERLPTELRLRVLQFTHLVARPSNDPLRRPGSAISLNRVEALEIKYNSIKRPSCLKFDTSRLSYYGDFCRRQHAAASPSCLCRPLDLQICRVSRNMYREAMEVFVSENEFAFSQSMIKTATFIDSLDPALAKMMRNITVLPTDVGKWKEVLSFATHRNDLGMLLKSIIDKLDVKKLKLTFDTSRYRDTFLWFEADEDRKALYEQHCILARELRAISGLKSANIRSCAPHWNVELKHQLRGGPVRDFVTVQAEFGPKEISAD